MLLVVAICSCVMQANPSTVTGSVPFTGLQRESLRLLVLVCAGIYACMTLGANYEIWVNVAFDSIKADLEVLGARHPVLIQAQVQRVLLEHPVASAHIQDHRQNPSRIEACRRHIKIQLSCIASWGLLSLRLCRMRLSAEENPMSQLHVAITSSHSLRSSSSLHKRLDAGICQGVAALCPGL